MASRPRKRGGFKDYNTDSEDDSHEDSYDSFEYNSTDSSAPTVATAPITESDRSKTQPDSALPEEEQEYVQRIAKAKKDRNKRIARMASTAPSVARLTFLEIFSMLVLAWAAVCCIVSGHILLVIILALCLFHPLKVVCPSLEDTERFSGDLRAEVPKDPLEGSVNSIGSGKKASKHAKVVALRRQQRYERRGSGTGSFVSLNNSMRLGGTLNHTLSASDLKKKQLANSSNEPFLSHGGRSDPHEMSAFRAFQDDEGTHPLTTENLVSNQYLTAPLTGPRKGSFQNKGVRFAEDQHQAPTIVVPSNMGPLSSHGDGDDLSKSIPITPRADRNGGFANGFFSKVFGNDGGAPFGREPADARKKRVLSFGESSLIYGSVGPKTFFIARRWQALLMIVYCALYFVGLLVINAGVQADGGFINTSYTTIQYKYDRSKMFYAVLPFLQRSVDEQNEVALSNDPANATTLGPVDPTVYTNFHPQYYLVFSLFTSDDYPNELTLSVVLLIIMLILAITLFVSLPKRVRYYDHQDLKQRAQEGTLNFVEDPLASQIDASYEELEKRDKALLADGKCSFLASETAVAERLNASESRKATSRKANEDEADGAPAADVPQLTPAQHQHLFLIQQWAAADEFVAKSILKVNQLSNLLLTRQLEADEEIGEGRYKYAPQHTNRNIRVSHLSFLLLIILVSISMLPSLMVGLPGIFILLITATIFMKPPSIAGATPPNSFKLIPGETRPRQARFPYYVWHPETDTGTYIRSALISCLYYSLCLVFVVYVAFQNPVLEDFNMMPNTIEQVLPFSGSEVNSYYYHRIGLYNLHTFAQRRLTESEFLASLSALNETSTGNTTVNATTTVAPNTTVAASESIWSTLDFNNGLKFRYDSDVATRIIIQFVLLFIAIIVTRTMPNSLFQVSLPEFEEDRTFIRQVGRLKNAQRELVTKVPRLHRTPYKPTLSLPTFLARRKEGNSNSTSAHNESSSLSPSPRREGANNSPRSSMGSPKPKEEEELNFKDIDEGKTNISALNPQSALETALQKTVSFFRAMAAMLYSFAFNNSPILTPPAYAVYCCSSPSLLTAVIILPLIFAFCFVNKRRQLAICKILFAVEIFYLTALVVIFALEYQYEDYYILRWIIIGSRSYQRSLNLATSNFILGIHSLCLTLIVSTAMFFVSAIAAVDEDDKGPRLGRGDNVFREINYEHTHSPQEKEALLRKYAVELEARRRKETRKYNKKKDALAARGISGDSAALLMESSTLASIAEHDLVKNSKFHTAPLVEVEEYVRDRSEHYRRKWRVQALVAANNILGPPLVKRITALYECRHDTDPLKTHKRLLAIRDSAEERLPEEFRLEFVKRLEAFKSQINDELALAGLNSTATSSSSGTVMSPYILALENMKVRDVSEKVLMEVAVKQKIEEDKATSAPPPVPEFGNAPDTTGATVYHRQTDSLLSDGSSQQSPLTPGSPPSVPAWGPSAKAKLWLREVASSKFDEIKTGDGMSPSDLEAYAEATEKYRDDFITIRKHVLPQVSWTLTSAELLVIHRYVQFYCPSPRYSLEDEGMRSQSTIIGDDVMSENFGTDPRPLPADGSPFVESPVNLDDLLLICACFKAGGSFIHKAKPSEAVKKTKDVVFAALEEDEEFCSRKNLEAGGPLLKEIRRRIRERMIFQSGGAGGDIANGADLTQTFSLGLTGEGPVLGEFAENDHSNVYVVQDDDDILSLRQVFPKDPALRAAAQHVCFCFQNRILQTFPAPEERARRRNIHKLAEKLVRRAIRKERIDHKKAVQLQAAGQAGPNTAAGTSPNPVYPTPRGPTWDVDNNDSTFRNSMDVNDSLNNTINFEHNSFAPNVFGSGSFASPSSPQEQQKTAEEEEDDTFMGRFTQRAGRVASDAYMFCLGQMNSMHTIIHRLLISTFFAVAVVGFCVAGYRNYFTFLHFLMMIVLILVLWSQVLTISKQLVFIGIYLAVTGFVIIAIVVATCLSEEMLLEWGSASVLQRPISGINRSREPLLVSIGVQGFQSSVWELLYYFLQFFVLVIQRMEFVRHRNGIYSRAQLIHVSLPTKAPTFDDEDDIDIRFEHSCNNNEWNPYVDDICDDKDARPEQSNASRRNSIRSDDSNDVEMREEHVRAGNGTGTSDGGAAGTTRQSTGGANTRNASDKEADDSEAFILTTRGVEWDRVAVESRLMVSQNRWSDLKAWIEWRILMTSPVFIRLQMYSMILVGVPLFISLEGFQAPNYWTVFFLLFFLALLTYSISKTAFESRGLHYFWMWSLVIATVATLTAAAYQCDPVQAVLQEQFETLRNRRTFVGTYCAKAYNDGIETNVTESTNSTKTSLDVAIACLQELGYSSVYRVKASLNGYAHFAIILVISIVQFALLRRYFYFHALHPIPQEESEAANKNESERLAKMQELNKGSKAFYAERAEEDQRKKSRLAPLTTAIRFATRTARRVNSSLSGSPYKLDDPDIEGTEEGAAADAPASVDAMKVLTITILTIIRDNCSKLHWAMCIAAALQTRTLTHAVYVLFFVFDFTGWIPLLYSALHVILIYLYPVSAIGEYWSPQGMQWVGVSKNTTLNDFGDKIDFMILPALVFLASLLYLNTREFSPIEGMFLLNAEKAMEIRLLKERAHRARVAAAAQQREERRKRRASHLHSANSGQFMPPAPPSPSHFTSPGAMSSLGTQVPISEASPNEQEQQHQRAEDANTFSSLPSVAWSMWWDFVLFVYHDLSLTMGYEILLLGLLIFMAVDTIRLISWFFFLSIVCLLYMGRDRAITSRFFLKFSQYFYCCVMVALQWLYIGHPDDTEIGDMNLTYKEAIEETDGGIRYNALKYVGLHPDTALVWTSAIAAFLFRLMYSQISYVTERTAAVVIAVPEDVALDKARAAGSGIILAGPNRTTGEELDQIRAKYRIKDGFVNKAFATTPEVIKYFKAHLNAHRAAAAPVSYLIPVGLIQGDDALEVLKVEEAARRKEEQIIKTNLKNVVTFTPPDDSGNAPDGAALNISSSPDKVPTNGSININTPRPKDEELLSINSPFNADQRYLLKQMLESRDSSVRRRAEQQLEEKYLRRQEHTADNSNNGGTAAASFSNPEATSAHAVHVGMGGITVTPVMRILADYAMNQYQYPKTAAEYLVWLSLSVFVAPVFVFADGVSGGSILHFLITAMGVYMLARRLILYWYPLPRWDRFIAFYVFILFAQMVCQIPPIAKLIELNYSIPKAIGFAGYKISNSYYDDGTAPNEVVMPLTAFRVMAIFFVVLQKRIFNSFSFLLHLAHMQNRSIDSITMHSQLLNNQQQFEQEHEAEVQKRDAVRSQELSKARREHLTKKETSGGPTDPNSNSDAAAVDMTEGRALTSIASVQAGDKKATTSIMSRQGTAVGGGGGSDHQQPVPPILMKAKSAGAPPSTASAAKKLVWHDEPEVNKAPAHAPDYMGPEQAEDDNDATRKEEETDDPSNVNYVKRSKFARRLERLTKHLSKHTYHAPPADPKKHLFVRFATVVLHVVVRYSTLLLAIIIAINFIVSGSIVDMIPLLLVIVGGIVWRPWAPRFLFSFLLYYTGIMIILKMFIRFMTDALSVDDTQARVLSAFFLAMPPNDLAGVRPSDLNRTTRGNVTVSDLALDFVVLIALQLHLHISDVVGVYEVDSHKSVEDAEEIEDFAYDSDMTQYSTDEEEEDLIARSRNLEDSRAQRILFHAVRENMHRQRQTYHQLLKLERPFAEDHAVIKAQRAEDGKLVDVLRGHQQAVISRGGDGLSQWDLKASTNGCTVAAIGDAKATATNVPTKKGSTSDSKKKAPASAITTPATATSDGKKDILDDDLPFYKRLHQQAAYNIGTIRGLGIDLYTFTFFWEVLTLIVTIFVYPELAGRNTGSIIQAITDNLLPGPLLAILLIFVLFMVIDRILYTYSSQNAPAANHLKWLFVLFLTLVYCGCYIYWLNAICAKPPMGGPFVMAMKSVYLLLGAVQVFFGYPLYRNHDPFTKRTGIFETMWTVMLAIPFLWDLRMYLDWCFTRTSLIFEDYLKVEGVHLEVYTRYCRAEQQAARKGTNQDLQRRILTAGIWFIVIMIIIFFPLMYFSGFNPRLSDNPVTNVAVKIDFEGFGSLYSTTKYVGPRSTEGTQRVAIRQMYPSLDLNDYFYDRLYQFIETEKCSGDVWGISPQGIESILNADVGSFNLNMEIAITRTNSVASDLLISKIHRINLDVENGQRLQDLVRYSLDLPFNATLADSPPPPARFGGVYDPFLRNSPTDVKAFSESSDFADYPIDCELNLNIVQTNISGTPQFVRSWCMGCRSLFMGGNFPESSSYVAPDKNCLLNFEGCEGFDYTNPTSNLSLSRPTNVSGIYFSVSSDQVPDRLSVIPADAGIIALYTTFVLALASVIRGRLTGAISPSCPRGGARSTEPCHLRTVHMDVQRWRPARQRLRPDLRRAAVSRNA